METKLIFIMSNWRKDRQIFNINFFLSQAFVFIYANVHITRPCVTASKSKQFINTVKGLCFEVSFQCCCLSEIHTQNVTNHSSISRHCMMQGNTRQRTVRQYNCLQTAVRGASTHGRSTPFHRVTTGSLHKSFGNILAINTH